MWICHECGKETDTLENGVQGNGEQPALVLRCPYCRSERVTEPRAVEDRGNAFTLALTRKLIADLRTSVVLQEILATEDEELLYLLVKQILWYAGIGGKPNFE